MARKKTTKKTAPEATPPEPTVDEIPEVKPVKPVTLGKTARSVLQLVIDCTFPKGDDDEGFVAEVVTARTIGERTDHNIGQIRTIMRNLRAAELINLAAFQSDEDRTFRYEAAEDAAERLAAGDKAKAEKVATRVAKSAGSSLDGVEPLAPELYAPLALKLAAIDRGIVRWTGTAYRERKAIKDAGNDSSDASTWASRVVSVDGKEHTLTANEVGPVLREIRKTITSDAKFRVAQRDADRELIIIVKGDDPEAKAEATTPAEIAAK